MSGLGNPLVKDIQSWNTGTLPRTLWLPAISDESWTPPSVDALSGDTPRGDALSGDPGAESIGDNKLRHEGENNLIQCRGKS